jgi:hypothetical protein
MTYRLVSDVDRTVGHGRAARSGLVRLVLIGNNLTMAEGELIITIAGADQHDLEELEEASRQLREELSEVDEVKLSEVTGGPAQEGTRSSAVYTVPAAIMITIYSGKVVLMAAKDINRLQKKLSKDVLPQVARIVHDWSRRHHDKHVIVKLSDGSEYDLTNFTAEEISSILQATPPITSAKAINQLKAEDG